MTTFAAKATPSLEKLRGGYYTPEPIADFVSEWVAAAGGRLLEPSCGDGNILTALARRSPRALGIELIEDEALRARERSGVEVVAADFFDWFDDAQQGAYDGVAGNPPYIRFGSWSDPGRESALNLMRRHGLRPSKLTNAWVPFVIASILAVRDGGRVGLVLPAELLQVGYAGQLRRFIIENSTAVSIVAFRELVFPGILQEVVILLAERGSGPAEVRMHEVNRAAELKGLEVEAAQAVRAPLSDAEKWTKYFLSPIHLELIRKVRSDERLRPVEEYASVDVGVVTGRNSFFVMTRGEARARRLDDLTIPLVTRSAQVAGVMYSADDHARFEGREHPTLLLDARGVDPDEHPGLADYIRVGESNEVHKGYKCRIRKDWWVVPSIWQADAFMLRQIHRHPRVTANQTEATSTDTVHRIRMKGGVDARKFAVAACNSVTFALTEVLGRSYGGGILELEPSEAEELRIPDPALVPDELIDIVDELIRADRVEDALDLVDRVVLTEIVGLVPDDVRAARKAWETLRDRRANRGTAKAA
ncbi:MAG: class I SAM-dependent methyltransferase [Protaetiibacter sp.]